MANKTVKGKQITATWHVDGLKISHVDEKVVTALINKLNKKYGKLPLGKEVPLTVRRGRVHEYLGMTLDYLMKNKVKIDMRDYLKKSEGIGTSDRRLGRNLCNSRSRTLIQDPSRFTTLKWLRFRTLPPCCGATAIPM